MTKLRIVLGNASLASYPHGGGHWAALLQYLFGLAELGHDVFWLEVMLSDGNRVRDQRWMNIFFRRFERYGFGDRCAVLLFDKKVAHLDLELAQAYGRDKTEIKELAGAADCLWNFCSAFRQPLLSLFKRRVLVDLDPGILQISALDWDMGIKDHQAFLTVGRKLHDPDCEVPTMGVTWHRFTPFVCLARWHTALDPGEQAPFSSVTQWTWEELWLQDRVLSTSKRDAYLRYLRLPQQARRPFELAVNIHPKDSTGDRELLLSHQWRLVHPHRVLPSPSAYRKYIKHSRAEFLCPKPIYRELKTGWFSDRSVFYLASGRPVLAEDTGFSAYLPTGTGLLAFRNMEEALAGVTAIDADFPRHQRAARELAEEFHNSRRCLNGMLSVCA
jgi:hypothetical protein